jgi:hypothetical protein
MSSPPLPNQESIEGLEQRLRSLLLEGRILDAQDLLATAGPDVPIHPKLREVLAPAQARKSDVRDVDRSADFAWLRANGARHLGQWVAVKDGCLAAAAPSLKQLRAQLNALPEITGPLVHRID